MAFNVTMHKDNYLTDMVKYRAPYSVPASLSFFNLVSVGNFSNKNVLIDNVVELTILPGYETEANFYQISTCNVIKLTHTYEDNTLTVIGFIIDVEYINDSNIKVAYNVDAFSSARASGLISSMYGLCERTHLNYNDSQSFVNLASEPFSVSDTMRAASVLSTNMNQPIYDFEGVEVTENAIYSADVSIVLTLSPAAIEYLGNPEPFTSIAPTDFDVEIKNISSFNFQASDVTFHSGGAFRGTPIVLGSIISLKPFIKKLCSGCGFETIVSASEIERRNMLVLDNGGAIADVYDGTGTDGSYRRYITQNDIYNVYVIPKNFAKYTTLTMTSYTNEIEGLYTLATMHGLGAEDNTKSKMLAFPYFYIKVVTSNGDLVTLSPQSFNQRGLVWDNTSTLILDLKFIGGDMPKLMGRFKPAFVPDTPNARSTVAEWFTIRSYPSLTLSIENSYNPQLQKDFASTRRQSALYTNAIASSRLSNPFKQGYLDGVNGVSYGLGDNPNTGFVGQFAGAIGNAFGRFDSKYGIASVGTSIYNDTNKQNAENQARVDNNGVIVSPDTGTIEGNDNMAQFSCPPISAYNCGGSNGEIFSACRYLDQFGQACNVPLNPLTNVGNLWNGYAYVTTFENQTFYKFAYIDVIGNVPAPWKRNIKALFENGVYLRGGVT